MRRTALVLAVLALTFAVAPAADAGSKTAALVAKVKQTRLSKVRFEETKLVDVVKWLRVATGMNFHIKKATLIKAGIELDDIVVTATLDKVKLSTFLEIVLETHDLGVKIKGNVIYITTKKDTYGKPVSRIYGISHITWTKTNFHGPEMNLNPSGETFDEEYTPEVVDEDDPLTSGDAVIELVKELTGLALWEDNDDWSISGTDTYMVVKAPKSIQLKVMKAMRVVSALK
ncbi:MAG: hypothetical protein QNJ98_07460 [Planctomycetota bacterium]|nr:hypothetical protein [Planctomycetota bacterium]